MGSKAHCALSSVHAARSGEQMMPRNATSISRKRKKNKTKFLSFSDELLQTLHALLSCLSHSWFISQRCPTPPGVHIAQQRETWRLGSQFLQCCFFRTVLVSEAFRQAFHFFCWARPPARTHSYVKGGSQGCTPF